MCLPFKEQQKDFFVGAVQSKGDIYLALYMEKVYGIIFGLKNKGTGLIV